MVSFKLEDKLKRQKYNRIVGIDEAGRGPLAGPVFAGAVLVKSEKAVNDLKEVNDSKKLSFKKREELYGLIISHPQIEWGSGMVGEKTIDRINILEATKLAMLRAIKNIKADFLIIDGNIKIRSQIEQISFPKADQLVFSCAAASIIAKVRRDRFMIKKDKLFPEYGFLKHKGYPTKYHREMIKLYGISNIHRKTFKSL